MGSIDVAADNGAPVHWASSCFGSWGATWTKTADGYLFSAGPSPVGVNVEGCENGGDLVQSPGMIIRATPAMTPGTYTKGSLQYTGAPGMTWTTPIGGQLHISITKIDPLGGYVDGAFDGPVAGPGNLTHSLTGSFHVCHVEDQLGQG